MTAEVAILNKSAIALAADSAVTLSVGQNQEKIFDSADKLFELCNDNPIAAMVNGGMQFVQIPLAVLVKKFRSGAHQFDHVEGAANEFLEFLNGYAENASAAVLQQEVTAALRPILDMIRKRFDDRYLNRYFADEGGIRDEYAGEDGLAKARSDTLLDQLKVMRAYLEDQPDALFVGGVAPPIERDMADWTLQLYRTVLPDIGEEHMNDAAHITSLSIRKITPLQSSTGLVVAGYGSQDLFPTLAGFDLYGAPCGRLKYRETHFVDIDRDGDRARVLPFAQREMVERFLYGLDESIENDIARFCRSSISSISESILSKLDMPAADKAALAEEAAAAEAAFLEGLQGESLESIRMQSRSEIEDMVEFMPKPEMARMAEALVNLTSIKRRVSRGMETVGGPIDVAVISQAEGFVWVKRKHYFPAELNSRYLNRNR